MTCTAIAMSASVGHMRIAAMFCVVLVVLGAGIYAMGGFGGFVLLGAGYAAAAALLVGLAAIAVGAYFTRNTSRR